MTILQVSTRDFDPGVDIPFVTQNRVWKSRDSIMEVLRSLGMPVAVDGSHIVIRGCEGAVRWLVSSTDREMSQLFAGGSEKYHKAESAFFNSIGPVAVKHVVSPGISIDQRGIRLDGVAMQVRFPRTGPADDGPAVYVVPVSNTKMATGEEWIETVALVPKQLLGEWAGIMQAADGADRALDAGRLVMRVFNGPDINIQSVGLDDIVMEESVKSSFVDDIMGFLSRQSWYGDRNLSWKRTYLLDGPPGTGKTTMARWAATQLGLPCIGFDFTDGWADGRTLNACINYASRRAPSVLIFDDLDKVLSGQNRTGITKQALQTALSGVGSMNGVILVATSNDPTAILADINGHENPMARRFDVHIEVPLPTEAKRIEYVSKLLSKDDVTADTIARIARLTDGWSYSDLMSAVTAAANFAVSRNSEFIEDKDVVNGCNQVRGRKVRRVSPTSRAAPEGDD